MKFGANLEHIINLIEVQIINISVLELYGFLAIDQSLSQQKLHL